MLETSHDVTCVDVLYPFVWWQISLSGFPRLAGAQSKAVQCARVGCLTKWGTSQNCAYERDHFCRKLFWVNLYKTNLRYPYPKWLMNVDCVSQGKEWGQVADVTVKSHILPDYLQSVFSTLSQGFEDDVLGNSPVWLADTAATYCPERPSQLTQENIAKHCDRVEKTLFRWSQLATFF